MREGWVYKKLGDVATLINGDRGKNYPSTDDFINVGVPFINAGHIQNGVVDFSEMNYISEQKFDSLRSGKVNKGDILFCLRGSLGKSALVNIDYGAIASSLVIIRPHSDNSHFIQYYIQSNKVKELIQKNNNGSSQPNLSATSVASFSIPVPPLSEQQRIVSELDLLSSIIEKKKAQLKEYDQLAQSIFYDMFGDPVSNEKGWEVKSMGELFDIGSSKRVFESQWKKEGVPFYRAREIVRFEKNEQIESPIFISEELFQEYANKYGVPSEGDIMVTAVGTLGVCYIVKKSDRFYFKDGNILWFKSKGLCETRFIKDQDATPYVVNQIQGNANAAVVGTYTITNAKKTKVIIPPLTLQNEYVKKIEAIEKQKSLIQQSITEAETLFDSRMDFWFS